MRVALIMVLFVSLASAPVRAQAPAPDAVAPATAVTTPGPVLPTVVAPVDNYTYQADGRRDPFLNLTANAVEPRAVITQAEGIAGLGVADLSVRGVMKSKGSLIAMVQGPDKKAFVVHPGDKLADGTVKAVINEGLVIVQQVNDPLSLVKQREVRKLLRSAEDGQQ